MKHADHQLVERARGGDIEAFGELWDRYYPVGIRAAQAIAPTLDPDDLVSEAFVRILDQLNMQKGPAAHAFRPYLYQVIRNLAATTHSQDNQERPLAEYDDGRLSVEAHDSVEQFNLNATSRAFSSLPVRWQEALWYTVVEGLPPRKAAEFLNMTSSAVSALALRSRKGLRKAWILQHVESGELPPKCQKTVTLLPKYMNSSLTPTQLEEFEAHIETCETCSELVQEGRRLFSGQGATLAVALLGAATATALKLGGVSTTAISAGVASAAGVFSASAGKTLAVAGIVTVVIAITVPFVLLYLEDDHRDLGPSTQDKAQSEHSDDAEQNTQENMGNQGMKDDPDAAVSSDSNERFPTETVLPGASPDLADGDATPSDSGVSSDVGPSDELGADVGRPTQGGVPLKEPRDPAIPEIDDSRAHTLPSLLVTTDRRSEHRLSLYGRNAEPGATVRVLVTSQPGIGAEYGTVLSTRTSNSGYWAFLNVGGVAPFGVTVRVQQVLDTEASSWETVVADETFAMTISSPYPGDYTGVTGWHVRGWPGAHWGLREVGGNWPIASGVFDPSGGAVIWVPSRTVSAATVYEVGYWVQGRFEPTHQLLRSPSVN